VATKGGKKCGTSLPVVLDLRPDGRIVRGIKIRAAIPSDAAVIADFNLRMAWETEGLRLDPEVVRQGVAAVLEDANKGIYYVADADGEVVGQLMIT